MITDAELKKLMYQVSKHCLRGETAPGDLRKLWRAYLDNDWLPEIDLVPINEGKLSEQPTYLTSQYLSNTSLPEWKVAAYKRMFYHVDFFAETISGGLIGYYGGFEQNAIKDSPVVELDTTGQFRLRGRTAAECLLSVNRNSFHNIASWLKKNRMSVGASSFDDIEIAVAGIEDKPEQLFATYLKQEERKAFPTIIG